MAYRGPKTAEHDDLLRLWLLSRGHDGADFVSKGCVKGVQAAPRAHACTLVDLSTDATLPTAQFERAVGKAARGQFT
jgi:hypothetical protein